MRKKRDAYNLIYFLLCPISVSSKFNPLPGIYMPHITKFSPLSHIMFSADCEVRGNCEDLRSIFCRESPCAWGEGTEERGVPPNHVPFPTITMQTRGA